MSDSIAVVGGGVAGLMTALRLAHSGNRVTLFESDLIGNGASLDNHGFIHSGALYVEIHPEVTAPLRAAGKLFQETFPNAVTRKSTWYVTHHDRLHALCNLWEQQQIPYRHVQSSDFDGIVHPAARLYLGVEIPELNVSTRSVLLSLTGLCVSMGVEIRVNCPVVRIRRAPRDRVGLVLGSAQTMMFDTVVLANGAGIAPLLWALGCRSAARIKARLCTMLAVGNAGLVQPIVWHQKGGLSVAPVTDDVLLVSLFGGEQRPVHEPRKWFVPVSNVNSIVDRLISLLHPSTYSLENWRAYTSVKVEYAAGCEDAGGGEPNFAVIDHEREDGIPNLWTLIPGKFSLAFHASRSAAERVLDTELDLTLPVTAGAESHDLECLVTYPTWMLTDSLAETASEAA
jgi:hypothetical protein